MSTMVETPAADCAAVASLLAGLSAPRPQKCHDKELTGEFRLRSGSVAAGFARFEYFKVRSDDPLAFFDRPAYLPIASRDERGWHVTCSCPGSNTLCKHARYLRMAVRAWPCEGAELVALAPEDGDGWAGPCSRCDDPECYRVTFHLPHGGYQHYFSCAGCGRRPRL